MKKAVIIAAGLLAVCQAEAHFDVSVANSPAVVHIENPSSFQFFVDYSPIDLSSFVFTPNPSWASFELSTAQLAIDISVIDSTGAVVMDDFFGAINANNKTAHPAAYASIPFDSAQPFSTTLFRSFTPTTPGVYTVNFSTMSLERVLRLPTAACATDPICQSDFYADIGDMTEFRNTTQFATSSITVSSAPEPETYAMLVAGLMLITIAARRASQKSINT